MNTIELRPAVEESQEVTGICVDGRSIRELFAGRLGGLPVYVSPFGWNPSSDLEQARRFLGEKDSEFGGHRYAILVCAECGDVGCGAISANIHRESAAVRWSDFVSHSTAGSESETQLYDRVAPLEFSRPQYEEVFRKVLTRG